MADKTIPTTINGYPVTSFIGGQGRHQEVGVAVVYRDDRLNNGRNYVCWRVWREAGTDTWHAESGVYDLSYEDALASLAYRSGVGRVSGSLGQQIDHTEDHH